MRLKYLRTILVGAMLTGSYFSGIANAALISSWDLSSDYSDSTGNGHDGTGGGTILPEFSTDAPGNFPGSVSFNNNNYIALNQYYQGDNSIAEMSASMWFKTSASGSTYSNWALLDFDRSEYFSIFVTGAGEIGFSTAADSVTDMFSSASNLNDGQWHNVAVSYSLTDGKSIYVDGILDSTVAYDGAIGTNNTRYGFIGDGSEASSIDGDRNEKFYDGQIASVKLWDNAITAQEVQAEVSAIPEPDIFAIFALGMMGIASSRFKKKC
jgi:hypothetical protein